MKRIKKIALLVLLLVFSFACVIMPKTEVGELALDIQPETKPSSTNTKVVSTSTALTVYTCTVDTGLEDGHLNLRSCPGTDCSVLAVLDEEDVLVILSSNYDWVNVETPDRVQGYVNIKYCRIGE